MKNLNKYIKKKGWRKMYFIKNVLNMSYETFNNQEKNNTLRLDTICLICSKLDCTFDDLIGGKRELHKIAGTVEKPEKSTQDKFEDLLKSL